ncbi:MAG: hypothetical protein L3K04_04315 [Thermoplasmata archaeon]|nr:hypothetical protein [Thermoplasmata archaeon]MCI4341842.1 hypothetical protein [Thermoplasmata archaeon]
MRRGLVIGGGVLLALGILLVLLAVLVQGMATSQAIPAGAAYQLSPPSTTIGSVHFSASWSGAAAGTVVYLVTGTPTCSSPTGVVANGSGTSGTISATLSSGTTYNLYACSDGTFTDVTVSWTATGISLLMIIGIVLAVIGVLLLVVGIRARPKAARLPPTAAEVAPDPLAP